MKVFIKMCCCFLLALSLAGCGQEGATGTKGVLRLHSGLEPTLSQALVAAYNQKAKNKIVLVENTATATEADIYIDNSMALKALAKDKQLKPALNEEIELVPAKLRDKEGLWCGVFYDPMVFLVNQSYVRRIGQEKLRTWYDLPKLKDARLVMENLSDNYSTKNFMACMASNMGQEAFIKYFKGLKPIILQYGKFPITSVRMAATGDADIALTRRSSVFKYLQSDFPAYIQVPLNGVPINLYGFALAANCTKEEAATEFIQWLLTGEEAKGVLLQERTGYLFVLPAGSKGKAVDADDLWVNSFYKDQIQLEGLAHVWLKEIRLEDNDQPAKPAATQKQPAPSFSSKSIT